MMLTLNERHLIECQGIQSNVLLLKLPFPLHGEITRREICSPCVCFSDFKIMDINATSKGSMYTKK